MKYIDEKFKDRAPEETVAYIQKILSEIGIDIEEYPCNTDIENLNSMRVQLAGGLVGTNGKGITPSFARASGYAEFMERLQMGLLCNAYSYLQSSPETFLQEFAPDKKYMTEDELIENGDWMDWIIKDSPEPLSRRDIAKRCVSYAFSDTVLTSPFYSLFEDKYVYLPAAFLIRTYTANGCCAGNSRDEAWIHAFSEIMERHNCEKILTSGMPAPKIPRDRLKKFPVVNKILETLEADNDLDISVFDYSMGKDFPVVSTRMINKRNHSYHVNVAADPVFEIAVQRTLTETFQGRNIDFFDQNRHTRILTGVKDVDPYVNISNQLRTSDGLYTVDFFADELTCPEKAYDFKDNSDKSNHELLKMVLNIYKKIGKPIYIRNFSFLGFPSFKIVVPGFSETGGYTRFCDKNKIYWFGHRAGECLRNIEAADELQFMDLFLYSGLVSGVKAQTQNFSRMAGIPLFEANEQYLYSVHFAYAAMRLGRFDALNHYLGIAAEAADDTAEKDYCAMLRQYFEFKQSKVNEEKIFSVLNKFYREASVSRLRKNLSDRKNVFDGMLIKCSLDACKNCTLRNKCRIDAIRDMNKKVGERYACFSNGQDKRVFLADLPL